MTASQQQYNAARDALDALVLERAAVLPRGLDALRAWLTAGAGERWRQHEDVVQQARLEDLALAMWWEHERRRERNLRRRAEEKARRRRAARREASFGRFSSASSGSHGIPRDRDRDFRRQQPNGAGEGVAEIGGDGGAPATAVRPKRHECRRRPAGRIANGQSGFPARHVVRSGAGAGGTLVPNRKSRLRRRSGLGLTMTYQGRQYVATRSMGSAGRSGA